jgi:hypothetical protein
MNNELKQPYRGKCSIHYRPAPWGTTMKNEQPMEPIKDHVNALLLRLLLQKHLSASLSKLRGRLEVLITIFIAPIMIAVWFGITAPVGDFLYYAYVGFGLGYILMALVTYTLNAVKSFIKGKSNGI